ncbi:MAG: CvpA family protein, partial [Gammaproteobacteria bacterium]
MTPLDWGILVFTLAMAVWGYAQGLLVGALSLGGLACGAFLGSRLAPLVLNEGSESPFAPAVALVGALLLGGMVASGLELLGFHLRGQMGKGLGVLDGMGGSLLIACVGLGLVWIIGAVALQTPGARQLRKPFQRSA